jgi:A/G-specific adenine glycosylase
VRPRDPRNTSSIRESLVAWFDAHKRDLPWRRTRDPYAVFVSEIMLQQTRVDTVIPYFERFLSRFPTVLHLAEAPLDDVLGLWSGLGYYRRARSLHLAAREVAEKHGGAFPGSAEALRSLPGVGAYTAGAIASIAFSREEPLVDGNVARVLSRIFAVEAPLGTRESETKLWDLARGLVRGPRPGDLNQALMELGATVCTPERPSCDGCPVERACRAREQGRVGDLPVPKAKKAPVAKALVALVARSDDGRILLAKRAEKGLFGGLWEPPMWDAGGVPPGFGPLVEDARDAGQIEHVLTHRALTVTVIVADTVPQEPPRPPSGYVECAVVEESAPRGTSTLSRKILRAAAPGKPAARARSRKAAKA